MQKLPRMDALSSGGFHQAGNDAVGFQSAFRSGSEKLPAAVVKKYGLWKDIVFRHGPEKLREFQGFHDEKLQGKREGQRSSRLSLQYRVIYTVEQDIAMAMVLVLEITPHDY